MGGGSSSSSFLEEGAQLTSEWLHLRVGSGAHVWHVSVCFPAMLPQQLSALPTAAARSAARPVYGPILARHVSFVNNIATRLGGSHVRHVLSQITTAVLSHVRSSTRTRDMKDAKIYAADIHKCLTVFVNAALPRPSHSPTQSSPSS